MTIKSGNLLAPLGACRSEFTMKHEEPTTIHQLTPTPWEGIPLRVVDGQGKISPSRPDNKYLEIGRNHRAAGDHQPLTDIIGLPAWAFPVIQNLEFGGSCALRSARRMQDDWRSAGRLVLRYASSDRSSFKASPAIDTSD